MRDGGWGRIAGSATGFHSAADFLGRHHADYGKEGIKSGQEREKNKKKKNRESKNIPGGSLASLPVASREEEEERDETKGTRGEGAEEALG